MASKALEPFSPKPLWRRKHDGHGGQAIRATRADEPETNSIFQRAHAAPFCATEILFSQGGAGCAGEAGGMLTRLEPPDQQKGAVGTRSSKADLKTTKPMPSGNVPGNVTGDPLLFCVRAPNGSRYPLVGGTRQRH